MKQFDIIALGELNVDLLLNNIEGFPVIGKEILAHNMNLTLGSSTAIFAANAASLGAKVAFVGKIGKDGFGDLVKKSLNERWVDTSYIIDSPTEATGLTVILNYDNDRANVTYPGAMDHLGLKDIDKRTIALAKHVHISSIFLQKQLHEDIYEIVRLLKSMEVTVSIDTQWDPAEEWRFDYKSILPMVDIFMPNEKELMALTAKDSMEDAVEAIKPYINVAVIKMGTKGSLLITKEGIRKMLPSFLNNNVVDAIGAGDSFNSGFLTSFVKGKDLEYCQWAGNLAGAINTTAAGGTGAFKSKNAVMQAAKNYFGQELSL